jgi:hypothetical protein
MGNGKREMGDGRWEMGDGRWEMGDGRWEMGDGNFGVERKALGVTGSVGFEGVRWSICVTTIKAGRRRQFNLPSWDGGFGG